jgi:hypothetical protein
VNNEKQQMKDMMVQLICMIGLLESKLCSKCDTEQAGNGDVEGFLVAVGGTICASAF